MKIRGLQSLVDKLPGVAEQGLIARVGDAVEVSDGTTRFEQSFQFGEPGEEKIVEQRAPLKQPP